jgi:hypothetical protein
VLRYEIQKAGRGTPKERKIAGCLCGEVSSGGDTGLIWLIELDSVGFGAGGSGRAGLDWAAVAFQPAMPVSRVGAVFDPLCSRRNLREVFAVQVEREHSHGVLAYANHFFASRCFKRRSAAISLWPRKSCTTANTGFPEVIASLSNG